MPSWKENKRGFKEKGVTDLVKRCLKVKENVSQEKVSDLAMWRSSVTLTVPVLMDSGMRKPIWGCETGGELSEQLNIHFFLL